MKNLYLILIVLLAFPLSGFSQGENDNWIFGENAWVNFSGTPTSTATSSMHTIEGSASISDQLGNLLFYTDGKSVWNKNHQIMTNGCCMNAGAYTSKQGVMIVPFPGHSGKYFIFTVNGPRIPGTFPSPIAYSVVDMAEDNGLGEIIQLNVPLENQNGSTTWNYTTEGITAITYGNKHWVLIPFQDVLLAYSVDATGVNTTPVVSSLEYPVGNFAQIKVSPNKNYVAITDPLVNNQCSLYIFNPVLGTIQTTATIVFQVLVNSQIYSSEFSSQSNIIWLSTTGINRRIYGYDLNNLTTPPTVLNVSGASPGTIQRGVDNEIYFVNQTDFLAKINNSNSLNATFDLTFLSLASGSSSVYGLPQLVPSSACIENLTLSTPEQIFPITHTASNRITTTLNYRAIPYGDTWVILSAGNYIEMLPGTTLIGRGYILAKIGGCDPSVPLPRPTSTAQNRQTKIITLPNGGALLSDFEIYPNPVSDILFISLPAEMDIKSATMYDLLGKATSMVVSENNTLNTSNLASGVYILKLETNQGTLTKKVIKN